MCCTAAKVPCILAAKDGTHAQLYCEADMILRPYRSVLYIPGGRERALDKARGMAVDSIIFDLEDAVVGDEKVAARATLVQQLALGGYGNRSQIIRINGLDTPWAVEDIAAISSVQPEAVLLPKVADAAMIADLRAEMTKHTGFEATQIWAMMETPRGILNALEIADAPGMGGLVIGTNDLAKDLNTRYDPARGPMMPALGMCLLAAKAAGIVILDGVYNAFKDEDGLQNEASQGRDMGFDGKTLIHPAQVAIANRVFAPSPAEIELAQRQIQAFEEVTAQGLGVAVVDGRIVENLHVETAQATLAKAAAIAELEMQT
jgi:(3S)-malyl-CoA thioesterase|tara:strand:- start:10463 stop:11416 length:954 start_codon:yes stop_codon:yes gene_type:complete